jgi:pimeloyl-ACP methyl ester carboxylesterase
MSTADNARDLDAIRVALGVPKISYLSYSWGTYLGQVYATLYPGHVRRMVLDSVVNPVGVWSQDGEAQNPAIQHRIDTFFGWIAAHHAVYRLGDTAAQVNAQYLAALKELTAHPVRGKAGPLVGPDELTDTLTPAVYLNAYWPALAGALAAYRHGTSFAKLVSAYVILLPGEQYAVFNAVVCSDAAEPRNWARLTRRRGGWPGPLRSWADT